MRLESSDSTVLTSNKSSPCSVTSNSCFGEADSVVDKNESGIAGRLRKEIGAFWGSYQSLVRKHYLQLELADAAIHRLLFWLPHHDNSGNGPPWREVLYGLLSVNELGMYCSQKDHMENSYGFSLCTRNEPVIPATSWRIALNVIHCLMPSILEISVANFKGSSAAVQNQRQAQVRLRLEQVKFAIRLYLLYSFWKQSAEESSDKARTSSRAARSPGIMLDGGLYHPISDSIGMSEEELRSVQQWRSYSGRRTGLRISRQKAETPSSTSSQRVILAELLYILRPLWWAGAEARHATKRPATADTLRALSLDPQFHSWVTTLAMDLVSLGLLLGIRRTGNPFNKEEWNRRRLKLFLYLLRVPIWNRVTSPVLEGTTDVALRVPLLGRLVDSYLWDWVLYWKHPFVSEEG